MAYDSSNKKLFIDNTDPDNPKGITLAEISRCLGDYRKDTRGNIDLGMMCTSPKINPWAKNKPTPLHDKGGPYIGMLSYELRKAANFGLNIPEVDSTLGIKDIYDAEESPRRNGWTHHVPDPYYNEYYRVTDFDGYAHNATCPFGETYIPEQAINMEGSDFRAMMTLVTGGGEDSEFISQSELPAISEKYFTVQIREKNGDTIRTTSASATLGEGGGDVVMSTFNLQNGEYDAIPFISPIQFDNYEGELRYNEVYHPLPKGKATVITIYDRKYTVIIEAWKISGELAIGYQFRVINHTAGAIRFDNNRVQVKLFGHSFDDPRQEGEKERLIISFTVPANGTYTSPESKITGFSQAVYDAPIMYFSFKSGDTVETVMPLGSVGDREDFD